MREISKPLSAHVLNPLPTATRTDVPQHQPRDLVLLALELPVAHAQHDVVHVDVEGRGTRHHRGVHMLHVHIGSGLVVAASSSDNAVVFSIAPHGEELVVFECAVEDCAVGSNIPPLAVLEMTREYEQKAIKTQPRRGAGDFKILRVKTFRE